MRRGLLMCVLLTACTKTPDNGPPPPVSTPDAGEAATPADAGLPAAPAEPPIVILMIGDGMGFAQLDAASQFRHGESGRLFIQQLPQQGQMITGSYTGLTDSSAAATAMSTGQKTHNRRMGVDRDGQRLETMVETAHRLGHAAGLVSTTAITHGTPGSFSAHQQDRGEFLAIANNQAYETRPEVMLGGGANAYRPAGPNSDRSDEGLIDLLQQDGWLYVEDRASLMAATPTTSAKLLGLFAAIHFEYVTDRPVGTTEPTITEMSNVALNFLDSHDSGFFLMIEGGRIDLAAHRNDLRRTIDETLAFDDAVRAVSEWAENKDNVTLIVTADHETGGLEIIEPGAQDVLPRVSWRWGDHTNARVPIFGRGPGTELFAGRVVENTWVHAIAAARLAERAITAPTPTLVPDGDLSDLQYAVVVDDPDARAPRGLNQLTGLKVDSDAYGLAVGVEGLFEWGRNTVLVLVDVDLGAGTGPAALRGAVTDRSGVLDAVIASAAIDAPTVPGFGIDFVAGSVGGNTPPQLTTYDAVGLRGIHPPYGEPGDLGWFVLPSAFGEGVRSSGAAPFQPTQGWELHLPWTALYGGPPPADAVVGVSVVVVDSRGQPIEQAMPPYLPGASPTALPAVVRFTPGSAPEIVGR